MKLILASDHAGFALKEQIKTALTDHEIIDIGCHSAERCDYPDFGFKAAEEFISQKADFGILVCGSGIGISIAANRNPAIRCALARSTEDATLARAHNNANMLALGERLTSATDAAQIVETFLNAKFEGGRHQERVEKLGKLQ